MRCSCGGSDISIVVVIYPITIRQGNELKMFNIPDLAVPKCNGCGSKIITDEVDAQINAYIGSHDPILAKRLLFRHW